MEALPQEIFAFEIDLHFVDGNFGSRGSGEPAPMLGKKKATKACRETTNSKGWTKTVSALHFFHKVINQDFFRLERFHDVLKVPQKTFR